MELRKFAPMPLKRLYYSGLSYLRIKQQLWDLRGNRVECPVCEWRGSHFIDTPYHQGVQCPKCHSDTRHRLLFASLKLIPELSANDLVANKDILHFAPEAEISRKLIRQAHRYVTAGLDQPGVDLTLDMTRMPNIEPESYDTIVALDVLEHVDDDRAALRELHRVLKQTGTAILTVPQKDHLTTTHEDPSITSAEDREKLFGQWNHVRFYGADFVDRVQSAGFRVRVVDANACDERVAVRFVLRPPRLNPDPVVANYRKMFFCFKESE